MCENIQDGVRDDQATIRVVIRWLVRLIDEPRNDVHISTKHQLVDVDHTPTQDSHYDVQLNVSDNLDVTHELDLEIVPESVHDDVQEKVHDTTPRPEGFLRVLSFLGAGTLNQTCYLLDNDADRSGVTTRYTGMQHIGCLRLMRRWCFVRVLPKIIISC